MPGPRFLLLLALLAAPGAQAQIYTWVDADGQKHFGSQPPTPEQPLETVEVRPAYQGSPLPAPAVPSAEAPASPEADSAPAAAETSSAKSEKPVPTRQMCSKALHWTGIDLPNLREIARERRRQGRIDQSQYQKAIAALDQVEKEATMPNCMASEGKDLHTYECMAQGLGIVVCSGALSEALNKF
ncbi:hypothetical protein A9179_07905 [Pseudomonas alcaligenes]|uniref:DUF4124 domain-containing protein n=1 Tax=Aquipseudomonas alcaligenes TaxID=43263 RepID=A0ABR7RXY4_AQUAC|nr:DUF4124 domain-containing protein [Pseudomonas alcaligenes]MBC9250196.1 hypothetical protein [Pseudomonas alcaligenes]